MIGATETLAKFAGTTGFDEIPPGVVDTAKIVILDTFGVMLTGSRDTACRILSQWVKDEGGIGKSTVIGQGFQSSPTLAALANGHAAHVLDYDDNGHFSTHTLPAILALGEPARISGKRLLQAYILGREVCTRLDAAFDAKREGGGGPTSRGWHHTGTNGSLGAAVSAGIILGLTVDQMRAALGIAANCASGLRANMGTMTKAMICGNAARNGVMSASLAKRGFTAEMSILEVPQGIANAFCLEGEVNWEALTKDLGTRYKLEKGPSTKEFPACSPTHAPLEAVLSLVKEHGIRAEDVDSIECDPHLFSLRRHNPRDAQEGQYSLEYCLSVALLDGRFGPAQMTDERVQAPDVQALMHRLRLVPLKTGPLPKHAKEPLTIYLRDGRSFTKEIDHVRLLRTKEEIEAKYTTCALRAIPEATAAQLKDAVLAMENIKDISPLMDAARG